MVYEFAARVGGRHPLSELARKGARRMLAQVLIAEADCFRASCRESGCHAIVLNAAFNLASSSFDSDVFNTRGL